MNKNKTISILNLLSFVIVLIINALATFGLLGSSTKEISDSVDTLLMPIGLTFSIVWSCIYIMLIAYTIYQLINYKTDRSVRNIGLLFLATNLLNILWILSYHAGLMLISTVVIIGLLVCLKAIVDLTRNANFITKTGFSIYYAWISVATVVSIFSYISSLESVIYDGIIIRIFIALSLLLLTGITIKRNRDIPYVLTILVAMCGILIKQIIDFDMMYKELVLVTVVGIVLISLVTIVNILNSKEDTHKIIEERG